MSRCPTAEEFQYLLAEQLSPAARARLEEHVEGCRPCQETLAHLTDTAAGINLGLVRGSRPPHLPESLGDFVRQLGEHPPVCEEPALAGRGQTEPASIVFPGPPSAESPLGQLESYRIQQELGQGKFGAVYSAYDALDRLVAIKVLKPELAASAKERRRFEEEAHRAAAVKHDHIVTIHQVGHTPGFPLPYLVMEYLEGESLADRLRRQGVLEAEEAAGIVGQVAAGLAAAHEAGLVHRDIKPSNIMIEKASGRAKITDFGLARAMEGDSPGTSQSGGIVGTPPYMSPEQIVAPRSLDARSDVYSVGVVLYELLTGRPPFKGPTPLATLEQVRTTEPVPPRRLQPKLPRDLETICLKCLHKEPAKRYARARDLAEDLHRFLAGKPILARPVRAWERVLKWARRRPAAAALVAVSSLASVLLVGGLVVAVVRENRAYQRERQTSYFNAIASAEHELAAGNWGRGEELLAGCPEDLRGWEWHYLTRLRHTPPISPLPVGERISMGGGFDLAFHPNGQLLAIPSNDKSIQVWDVSSGQKVLTLRGHTGRVLSLAFSPGGRRLASTSEDTTVCVWDMPGLGEPGGSTHGGAVLTPLLTLRDHKERVIGVAFSPDGQHLASASASDETDKPGEVKVWDAASGKRLFSFPGQAIPYPLVHLAFSPDGRRLASGSVDNTVKVWDLSTGQPAYTLSGHTEPINNVTFSPDGRRLISAGQDRVVNVWDLPAGEPGVSAPGGRMLAPSWTLPHYSNSVWCLALSPDGSCLAIGGPTADGNVRVYDTTTRKLLLTLRGDYRVVSVAFSPDGRCLASAGYDRIVRLWDTTTGHEVLSLRGHADLVGRVLFSPDGQRLASASADGTVQIWDASPCDENADPGIRTLGPYDGEFFGVAFSPKDSGLLASACADGSIKLFDVQTGQEVRAFRGHKEAALCVAFSPDGQRLLSGSMDKTVKLWDTRTGEELLSRGGFKVMVFSVAFRPDGQAFATGSSHSLHLWDAQTGQLLQPVKAVPRFVCCVTFSRDGKYLATVGELGTAKVWDVTNGEEVCSFTGHPTSVFCVAFHPAGKYLASGDSDFEVKLWEPDPPAGRAIHTLAGHTDYVWSLAFSPDGKYLATASWREIIVWDANRFEKLQTFGRLAGRIWSVAFSPDGKRLAAATQYKGKGEIKIWDASIWDRSVVRSP